MSPGDAKLFETVCVGIWFLEGPRPGAFIPRFFVDGEGWQPNFTSDDLICLQEAGLVTIAHVGIRLRIGNVLRFGSQRFRIAGTGMGVEAFTVTRAGQELARILTPPRLDDSQARRHIDQMTRYEMMELI